MVRLEDILGYEILATLGHGARSTIYAVKDKKNQLYALKRVIKQGPSDQRFIEQAILEHEIASKFNHPSLRKSFKLIKLRKIVRTSEVIVLMELIDGLTLEQYRPHDVAEICEICKHVASGLGVMHDAGYIHCDIKPNNILITDANEVKIIDFGQSCAVGTVKERIQGTPDYIAPEQVRRQKLCPQTDVFNLGATIYWLLTNQHVPTLIPKAPADNTTAATLRVPTEFKRPEELNPEVPPALSRLVIQCVENEVAKRPESIREVYERLDLAISQLKRQARPVTLPQGPIVENRWPA